MLKWAVLPRSNVKFSKPGDTPDDGDKDESLTLEAVIEQYKLPCLVRIGTNDNYCILLCETNDPYLTASNETKQFALPISFDGLFALVEHGVTRYNIVQSIHSLQAYFKSSSSFPYTHFTTLQPYVVYSNPSVCRIDPGTLIEPCHRPVISSSSTRLRTLFASLPNSLNRHLLSNQSQKRSIKKQLSTNEHFEAKSNLHDEILTLKSNSMGIFVPIYTQLPSDKSQYHSTRSVHSSNQIQGLYTMTLLSQLTRHYPLLTELIVSRTLDEHLSTTVEYPFRRLTFHRLIDNHRRIIAFDMKNYTFLEIDAKHSMNMYAVKQHNRLSQRYPAQLRWCQKYLSLFRSQIKNMIHSSDDTTTFIQATHFHRQQSQEYHQRRNSSSLTSTSALKHMPTTPYTSQGSVTTNDVHTQSLLASKFYTISHHSTYEQKQRRKELRKHTRVHFNDSIIERHPPSKRASIHTKHSNHRVNPIETGRILETEDLFQSTAL